MNRTELKEIVLEQEAQQKQQQTMEINLIRREAFEKIDSYVENSFVIVISGIRRCGKSTLLGQIRRKYPGHYLNFDDERLINFKLEDFQVLEELFIELFGEKNVYYFDEIQNIVGWERFVRRLHDERKKVFVTGSNASMLSRELGTHLTGRHLDISLYPFSFKEFLEYKNFKLDEKSVYLTAQRASIKKYFNDYIINGGIPEFVRGGNKEYLKSLYENILYRDIIVRYNLSSEKTFKELVYLAVSNISKEISFNSIKKNLNLGSSTTVKDYFDYLENSFLVFLVPRFDYSLKKQIHSNKKVYIIDNGIAMYLGFRMSKDIGRLLENMVFVELKRRKEDIYYYADKNECDFVLRKGIKIIDAIQVCYDFNDNNKEREINGLLGAMKKFKLKEGIILTYDQEEEIKEKGMKIKVIPVWKWLLSN